MKLFISAFLLGLLTLVPSRDERTEKALQRGRDCCKRFFAGDVASLWNEFDGAMRQVIGNEESFKMFREQAIAQLGAEKSILDESAEVQGSEVVYVRKSRFEKLPVVIEVVFGFDAEDKINTFVVRPAASEAPTEFLEYTTKTKLRLPFDGEWFVFWGGRTLAKNYHAAVEDQRFAYDIIVMKDGSSHSGDGKKNEDYYCYGRPILAPASGVVARVLDGIDENVPGEINSPKHAAGNHVVIEHGNGEYSMLAHFQKGSIKVKSGDRVESGTLLALCGNSGNSSEPHLHYHLQNTPEFHKGQGLPAQFEKYTADGVPVERGEPTKGQRIQPR